MKAIGQGKDFLEKLGWDDRAGGVIEALSLRNDASGEHSATRR
jgi:hypothetical protein